MGSFISYDDGPSSYDVSSESHDDDGESPAVLSFLTPSSALEQPMAPTPL